MTATTPLPPSPPVYRGVLVDWYSIRTRSTIDEIRYGIAEAFIADGLCAVPVEFGQGVPRHGFAHALVFTMADMRLGEIQWGGRNVNGWALVSMSGAGCSMVADWTAFDAVLRGFLSEAQFKRVDLALDYLDGSLTFERAEAAWDAGGFDPVRGPRPARNRQGYPEAGRTFYVGKRATSDRFFRVYDKGLEQGRHLLGDGFDPRLWVRAEVEFKPCNGPIPMDVIASRDAFFAGAAPFFAELLAECSGRRRSVRDPVAESACTVADAVRNLRRSGGPILAALLEVYGSPEALIAALTAGVLPSPKLIEAGARLLTREDMAALGL